MKKLAVIGAGGHGKVIADIAAKNGYKEIVFLDDDENVRECGGYPVTGTSSDAEKLDADVIVGIGNSGVRRRIQESIEENKLATLVHPNAVVADDAVLGPGTVVMAGAVINSGAVIGKGCIINTGCSVDHDCKLGDYVHISVGSRLCGAVRVEDETWIGAGATVSNHVSVCSNCMIGVGAAVIDDIKEAGTYVGIPAKKIRRKRRKFLMTATVASMIGQFHMRNLELLTKLGFEVHVACNFQDRSFWQEERTGAFQSDMQRMHIVCHQIDFSRNPFDVKRNFIAYQQTKKLIGKEEYDVIHCHTPVASAIVRMIAGRKKAKVIYTAHGFHFYQGAPLGNWLFYPVEKFLSRRTDLLITINREDYRRAKDHFHAKNVVYLPGVGIDLQKFHPSLTNADQKRTEFGLTKQDVVLLSVGELNRGKNHETVIRALKKLKDAGRFDRIHYYICGTGALQSGLPALVRRLGMEETVHFLGFRTDISELCQTADLYIFPSFREGLPVALMEAIACRTPVVCSKIRGNKDLVGNEKDMFDPKSADSVAEILKEKLMNASMQIDRAAVAEKMEKSVEENARNLTKFDLAAVEKQMYEIYSTIVEDECESKGERRCYSA